MVDSLKMPTVAEEAIPEVTDLMTEVPSLPRIDPKKLKAKLYRIGTKPECPRANVVISGVCFPLHTEKVEDRAGDTIRIQQDGDFVFLTEEEIRCIKEAVSRRVVREQGGRRDLIDTSPNASGMSYVPVSGDQPLSKYLYMIPVKEDPDIMKEAMGQK